MGGGRGRQRAGRLEAEGSAVASLLWMAGMMFEGSSSVGEMKSIAVNWLVPCWDMRIASPKGDQKVPEGEVRVKRNQNPEARLREAKCTSWAEIG